MIAGHARIFVATAPIDFRGSFDRLAGAVRAHLQQDPRSGAYFVFFNRNADRVKVFFFDQTGDCILYKRLDRRTFRGIVDLDTQQPRIEIHNNLVELQMRHFAVGRKNWLFYGSEHGAEVGSTWLTLVLSARMHGLHVEPYFRELFRVLPSWPKSRILELAPHAWAATRLRLDAGQLAVEYGTLVIPPRAAG